MVLHEATATVQLAVAVTGPGIVGRQPGPLDVEARRVTVLDRLLDRQPAAHVGGVQRLGPGDRRRAHPQPVVMVLRGEAVNLFGRQRLGLGDGSRHRHVEPLVAELALEGGGVQRLQIGAVVLDLLGLVGRQARGDA